MCGVSRLSPGKINCKCSGFHAQTTSLDEDPTLLSITFRFTSFRILRSCPDDSLLRALKEMQTFELYTDQEGMQRIAQSSIPFTC